MPVLLAQLTKQEEDQDKDQGIWNLSMAAGTCLMLFATVAGPWRPAACMLGGLGVSGCQRAS